MDVLRKYLHAEDVAIFIDPPYPKSGDRLYKHSEVDHEAIFEMAASASGRVLLTHDDSEEIKDLTRRFEMQSAGLVVSTTHHTEKKELLIGKNLEWIADL